MLAMYHLQAGTLINPSKIHFIFLSGQQLLSVAVNNGPSRFYTHVTITTLLCCKVGSLV